MLAFWLEHSHVMYITLGLSRAGPKNLKTSMGPGRDKKIGP